MKVLLVNPKPGNIVRGNLPPVVEDETGMYPPLGLLYVAAHAEAEGDTEVSVLDCEAEGVEQEGLAGYIQDLEPDIVGIQVLTFTLIDALDVAREVKRITPKTYVVFGGPHSTLFPRESLQLGCVDAVVLGEGEYTFANLLNTLRHGHPPEEVRGVITARNMNDAEARTLSYIQDLDALHMPARHLTAIDRYFSPMARRNPLTTMMSSRGCPARCTFCDRPQMGKVFRKRSAKSVVREMHHCLEKFGIGDFVFYDDTFTIDRKRVIEIARLINDDRLDVRWDIRARVDTMTPEMIGYLRRAGCHRIHYGVETGSARIQKRLKKNLDLKKVREIFSETRESGIETLGYFMIGCPDEQKEDLEKTFDLLLSLPMDYAHIGIFTPFPGTEIYDEALSTGMYERDYWREFASHPTKGFHPRYWNQHFSNEELHAHLKRAYASFYRRPAYILEMLMKVRSLGELYRKGKLGFQLLTGL